MKAKTSIKKALSLIVVLVMLLTMIPAGMISVGAEEATIDLSNYDYEDEFVIMNVEDWLLIARTAQDKDFSGKTVRLGADLDFGAFTDIWDEAHVPESGTFPNNRPDGTPAPSGNETAREYAATVPTLFNNFAGVFEGDGHTISNAQFEEGGIAKRTLDGAEIYDVIFDNVSVADFYEYFGYGIVVGESMGSLYMEGVHIVNSNVYADTFDAQRFASAAALIGLATAAEGVESASVVIYDCSVAADVACGGDADWTYGYGTGMAVGTVDSNVDFEMTYCSFTGSLESVNWYAGVIGALYVGKEKTATITDITIDGLKVNSARAATTRAEMSFGTLAGAVSLYDNASCTIDRITVTDASVTTLAQAAGGLIGTLQPLNSPANVGGPTPNNTAGHKNGIGRIYTETVEGASIEISNVYVDAFVWVSNSASTSGGIGAAGLIAQLGQGTNVDSTPGRVMAGEVNIYNVYVGGTLLVGVYDETNDAWTLTHGAGGLFFCVSLAEADIHVSNVVIDAVFPVSPQYMEAPENLDELLAAFNGDDADAKAAAKTELEVYYSRTKGKLRECVSLITAGGHSRQEAIGEYTNTDPLQHKYLMCDLWVSDVATTLRGKFNVATWLNRKGGINYNGEYIGRGDSASYSPPVENDGSIIQVRPIEAKQMVQRDEDGFITKVTGALAPVAVQAAGNDIRFIALAYVDAVESATATVTFKAGSEEKTFTFDAVSLLDGLTAVEGTDIAEYDATDFYAKKFMAVTIKNIPADTEYFVTWSFEYVTADGATVTSETATGLLNADGSFELY